MSSSAGEIKELFLDALELEGAPRDRFLAELRRRSPDVAERIDARVAVHAGVLRGRDAARTRLDRGHDRLVRRADA